jgi:hypothetical protein
VYAEVFFHLSFDTVIVTPIELFHTYYYFHLSVFKVHNEKGTGMDNSDVKPSRSKSAVEYLYVTRCEIDAQSTSCFSDILQYLQMNARVTN